MGEKKRFVRWAYVECKIILVETDINRRNLVFSLFF